MRRLPLLASCFLQSLILLGCGDDTTSGGGHGGDNVDDGGGGSGGGEPTTRGLSAAWSISVEGIEQDCFFAGASWVDLAIQGAEGASHTVRFTCEEASGETPLEPGSYTVTASLVTFDEATVITSEPLSITIEEDVENVAAAFDLPGAQIGGSWSISKDGERTSCDAAGAHRVEILASSASGFAYSNTFECPLNKGITDYFPLGEYEVFVSLLYEQDVVLVTSEPIEVSLGPAGATVAMDPVEFVLQDM